MTKGRFSLLFLAGVLSQYSTGITSAATFGIDQRNDGFTPGLFQSIPGFSPIGQEFTPAFSTLNFVDLNTTSFDLIFSAELFVNIRSGTIAGPIIGTSVVTPVDQFSGETHFSFTSDVPLVPGAVYVIDVGLASGTNWGIGSSGGPFSTYAGGRQILLGQPVEGNDLWFREGSVPEPGGCSFLLIGSIILLVKRVRTV